MKLLDLFADRVLEMPLFEMAMRRKLAVNEVRSKKPKIAEHIIKSLIFNSRAQAHWYVELNGWLDGIRAIELKPNGDSLGSEIYFEVLFNEYYGHGESVLEKQVKGYLGTLSYKSEARTDIPVSELWDKLKIVYIALSKDLEIGVLNSKGSQYYIELVK